MAPKSLKLSANFWPSVDNIFANMKILFFVAQNAQKSAVEFHGRAQICIGFIPGTFLTLARQ
jgi:hypothetical protein